MRTIVVGANRGLGLAFVDRCLKAGHEVIATARDLDAASGLRELLDSAPGRAQGLQIDVRDDQSVRDFVDRIPFDQIDLVIHNAGAFGLREQGLRDVDPKGLLATFDVNSVGPLRVAKALWPKLSDGSRFVTLTSLMGSIADASGGSYAYRMSKTALNMAVKCLGLEAAPEGKIVFAMHPGWVRTDMGGPNAPLSIDESVDAMVRTIENSTPDSNGRFFDRNGEPLPY